MCSFPFMDIISVYYIFAVRPDEATEPPATSEKLEAGALLQKQYQKETKSSDDSQQAELILPSPGHNCNLCKLSLLLTGNFTLQIFCHTKVLQHVVTFFKVCNNYHPLGEICYY